MTELELEQLNWQETRRNLETELAEARSAIRAAKERSTDLTNQIEGARKTGEYELYDCLLKSACLKAKQDANTIGSIMDNPEFVQCRSCAGMCRHST